LKSFRIFLVFALVSLNLPSFAFASDDIVVSNVKDFQKWFLEHLMDFGKYGKTSVNKVNHTVAATHGNDYKSFKTNSYDTLASTKAGKADLLSKLQLLSSVYANTAGTASGPANAEKLMVVSNNLTASNDGDLKAAGKVLSDESTALSKGDTVAADNCVTDITSLSSAATSAAGSSGAPSSDSATEKALTTMIAGLVATAAGSIGGVAISGVLALLGVTGGSNGQITGIGQTGVKSLASGASTSSAGTAAISSSSSLLNADLNTVSTSAAVAVTSSGTSGAPSSH